MFWEIVSPLFLYFIITALTLVALDFLMLAMPQYLKSMVFRQLISSIVVFFFLWTTYTQNKREKTGVTKKAVCISLLIGVCFAIAWNNILGLTGIVNFSEGYRQVSKTFYTGQIVLEIAALCIVIPIVEELLYRGIIYDRIRSWLGMKWALVLSAIIFGLVHMNLVQFVYATVFGVVLAFMTEKTGNFYAAAIAHMAANFTSVLRAETTVFSFLDKSSMVMFVITILFFIISAVCIRWFQNLDS